MGAAFQPGAFRRSRCDQNALACLRGLGRVDRDRAAISARIVVLAVAASGMLTWWFVSASAAAAGWSIQRAVSPANSPERDFFGVSCASRTACVAVGDDANEPLTERWNGVRWANERSPTRPTHGNLGGLEDVSCRTATACTATGSVGGRTLAERSTGTSWTIQRTPNPPGGGDLSGLSCASPMACTAVGWFVSGVTFAEQALAEQWDGVNWTIEPTPAPPGATASSTDALSDVSCTSATNCTAVGQYAYLPHGSTPLAEHWNGVNWSIEQIPQPAGAKDSELLGVSCASMTVCIAVGDATFPGRGAQTLAERWNGVSWTIQPTPSVGRGSDLFGVSCPTATVCTAVGNYAIRDGTTTTLAERWNRARWTIQRTAHAAAAKYSNLFRVSCATARVCTAVGVSTSRAGTLPLVERYS
jgi:hypothetical protein